MNKIEEVKRILQNTAIKGSNQAEVIAREICQLFEPEKCPECKGTGEWREYDSQYQQMVFRDKCFTCHGTGKKEK